MSGSDAHPVYAPMLLPDAATAQALRPPDRDRPASQYFDKVTVAAVSIKLLGAGHLDGARHAQRRGARARYACWVSPEMSAGTFSTPRGAGPGRNLGGGNVAVEADQLRRIPEVVAIAGAQRKAGGHRRGTALRAVTSLVDGATSAGGLPDDGGLGAEVDAQPDGPGRHLTAIKAIGDQQRGEGATAGEDSAGRLVVTLTSPGSRTRRA
ncbi:sugar-binding domain-containing protein [Streptomyces thinghirensis]|nr:sugar-binding domain-containing protein [Streptomyces thinghirensis]